MNTSSYEVEVKLPIFNQESIESALLELGSKKTNTEIQTDVYFNHPSRSFEHTDEALRIRSRSEITELEESSSIPSQKTEMTYKGPKIDTTTKTRLELSLGISDVAIAETILEQLGFQNVATLKKRRSFYLLGDTVVSIDDVEHVGLFIELERVVESEDLIPSAREVIFEQIEKLGLNPKDSIRESYLELYLRKEHF
ncbi:MAG: class IV adenylate cyclase [Candidatus Thorarchaeota archaeon]|jgi:adenylate cyclase class 2